MSAIFAECKLILVVAGVLAINLAAAWRDQAEKTPLHLPAADPALYGRLCAVACPSPADETLRAIVNASIDPAGPHR